MTSMIDIAAWTAASALLHKITSMIDCYIWTAASALLRYSGYQHDR